MKPLKKANQKNVSVDMECYTKTELQNLLNVDGVSEMDDHGHISDGAGNVRVFLSYVKDLKVTLINGYYNTVAIMNSGETIRVNL